MNILEFMEVFPTEDSCKIHFKQIREKAGITCKKCGNRNHYWLASKWQWQCISCNFRTTLKTVKNIASTGVDRISVGKITHSAPSINFKLEV